MKRKSTLKLLYFIALCAVAAVLILIGYRGLTRKATQVILPNDRVVNPDIDEDTSSKLSDAEKLISLKMNGAEIPGLSVAIVRNGETVYTSGFGVADLASGRAVTSDTLFQLGSNSKAFTALGVFQLQRDGLLDVGDPIMRYIPWLTLLYHGEKAEVTIEEFLNHTSGLPYRSIYNIPELDETDTDAIEKTVRTVVGIELASAPGMRYEYATINYDVLGLLIETVSGMPYEAYMQKYVLDAGGLRDTYLYRSQAEAHDMASGYRIGFFAPRYDRAPRYDGNKPAGYIISNANDMAEWLKIQVGTSSVSTLDGAVLDEAHKLRVETFGSGMYYAAGWQMFDNDGVEFYHAGKNPNYSSYIVFRPAERFGVAVLCNIKSNNTMDIGESIVELFVHDRFCDGIAEDENIVVDKICTVLIFAAILLLCLILYPLVRTLCRLAGKKQNLDWTNKKQVIQCAVLLCVFLGVSILLYFLPGMILDQATWNFLFVWYAFTVQPAVIMLYLCLVLSVAHTALKILSKPRKG